jgi:hypothetical protein
MPPIFGSTSGMQSGQNFVIASNPHPELQAQCCPHLMHGWLVMTYSRLAVG